MFGRIEVKGPWLKVGSAFVFARISRINGILAGEDARVPSFFTFELQPF